MAPSHGPDPDPVVRRRYAFTGTVQGVGFRPFLHRITSELRLSGTAGNDATGAWCIVQGPAVAVDAFELAVRARHPPLAVIDEVEAVDLVVIDSIDEHAGVTIEESLGAGAPTAGPGLIPPDAATCGQCRAEVVDPDDRRFDYPFTCCTDCGARYAVVRGLPYDRERTSLAPFPLCEACEGEYRDPSGRRFHAQAICCPACGPAVAVTTASGRQVEGALDVAAELLVAGRIVAVKGLGGYQLVCRADDESAVGELRRRKRREEKPFAVLVADLDGADRLVRLSRIERLALGGPEAPIVLARGRPRNGVGPSVAPGSSLLGVMLPATALHTLLVERVGSPLICTSGNVSSEPIVIDDETALGWLGDLVDGVLTHDRAIERRADDSVGQVVNRDFQLLRRARGFTPRPVSLTGDGPVVLGVGAELKSTVTLAAGRQALVSVHLGDLENPPTLQVFESTIADLLALTGLTPRLVVHDLHPEYLSTKFAVAQDLAPSLGVQHHHAHFASCLADNRHPGPAVGITFDGLGWGTDGSAWGGEILVGDAAAVERFAHLRPVAMPGGSAAIRHPWRMAIGYLVDTYGPELPPLALLDAHPEWADVARLAAGGSALRTTAVGRLFDAVAALCGIAGTVSYEGQAAIGLEQLAATGADGPPGRYRFECESGAGPLIADHRPVVRAVVDDLLAGAAPRQVARRFHEATAELVVRLAKAASDRHGLSTVALSGGVFQNRLLVELVAPQLEREVASVLRHRQVPPNDGGVSLGQAMIGRAHLIGDSYAAPTPT